MCRCETVMDATVDPRRSRKALGFLLFVNRVCKEGGEGEGAYSQS